MAERTYATRRQSIINAIVDKLKEINGAGNYLTDLGENVHPRLKFWDEVEEFPALHLNAGSESREYQGGGYKDRFLSVTIRCYVNEEDAVDALEMLLEDVETVIEDNNPIVYTTGLGTSISTIQTTINSIDTDEGVLEPFGIGEIIATVQY